MSLSVGAGMAIAAGVSSLFNALFTSATNKQSQDFQSQMMDKQNEYNSYGAVAQRMRDAGLSPAFMFGNGAGEGSASIPSSPGLTPPQLDMQTPAELFLKNKQVENETVKTQAETEKLLAESDTLKVTLQSLDERNRTEIDKIKSDKELNDETRSLRVKQQEEATAHAKEMYQNAELLGVKIKESEVNQKWFNAQIERLNLLKPLEARSLAASAGLSEAQANVAAETVTEIKRKVVNMIKEGHQIDASVMSQTIDNVVKEIQASNKIDEAALLGASPLLNVIYQNCNGMLGDLVKLFAAPAMGAGNAFNGKADFRANSQKSKYNNLRDYNNSWMFSE